MSRMRRLHHSARGASALWVTLATSILVIAAAPTFRVPVIGDDLYLAQNSWARFGGSWSRVLAESWTCCWQTNRFNPTGRFFAYTYHFGLHDLGVTTGIDMQVFYRVAALTLLIASVAAASFAIREGLVLVNAANARLSGSAVFAGVAVVTAATLQLHPWSHDPFLTITDVGLGTVPLMFGYLGLAMRFVRAEHGRTWVQAMWLGAFAVVGITFYESFVGAVVGVAVILGWHTLRRVRDKRSIGRPLALAGAGVGLPFVVFVMGRLYVATLPLVPYDGTEIAIGGAGVRTLATLVAGTVPGASWAMASRWAPQITVTGWSVATAAAIAILIGGYVWFARLMRVERVVLGWRSWPVVVAFLCLGGIPMAAHAFTVKYTQEITRVGQVHLSYTAAAIIVSAAVWVALAAVPRRIAVALAVVPVAGAFVLGQQAVNWSVADFMGRAYSLNFALTQGSVVWSEDVAARCDVLEEWSVEKGWDPRYREAVVDDTNAGYDIAFGEPYCDRAISMEPRAQEAP